MKCLSRRPATTTWNAIAALPVAAGETEADPQEVEFEHMIEFLGGIFGGDPFADEEMAEAMEIAERREAVAQLGRIIEGLTILTAIHADLVKATVEG